MNLDEFIVPSSIASPAGIETSPATTENDNINVHPNTISPSGIPIKGRKEQHPPHGPLVPASLPYPSQELRRNEEFGYVQRRVRKTSVDERKVSLHSLEPKVLKVLSNISTLRHPESVLLNFRPKSYRRPI